MGVRLTRTQSRDKSLYSPAFLVWVPGKAMAKTADPHWLVVAAALFIAVLCLGPAALGGSPDQAWTLGFDDNDDFDDVLLINGSLGPADRNGGRSLRPQRLDTRRLSPLPSTLSRAPPIVARGSCDWHRHPHPSPPPPSVLTISRDQLGRSRHSVGSCRETGAGPSRNMLCPA